jgi:hypothetical protein
MHRYCCEWLTGRLGSAVCRAEPFQERRWVETLQLENAPTQTESLGLGWGRGQLVRLDGTLEA